MYAAVQSLTPQNEAERAFKAETITKAAELDEMRWLPYEQSSRSISTTLLFVLVCWLAILFISFGLFASANGAPVFALMGGRRSSRSNRKTMTGDRSKRVKQGLWGVYFAEKSSLATLRHRRKRLPSQAHGADR